MSRTADRTGSQGWQAKWPLSKVAVVLIAFPLGIGVFTYQELFIWTPLQRWYFNEYSSSHDFPTTRGNYWLLMKTDRNGHHSVAGNSDVVPDFRGRHYLIPWVCQLFCVNGQVLFLGWEREGRGNIPSLAQRCRKILRFHDAILSSAGIRSGHRIVKWFKASRQWWIGMVHFFAACRRARNSNFSAASSLGNPPRVLMILRSDRFSDSTLLVV